MRIYVRALSYFRADAGLIAGLVLLVASAAGAGLCAAWPLALLVDTVLDHGSRSGEDGHRWAERLLPVGPEARIVTLAAAVVGLRMLTDGLVAAHGALANRLNWRGTRRVRADLYRALRRLGRGYYAVAGNGEARRPAGDALYRFTLDTFGPQQLLAATVTAAVAAATVCAVMGVLIGQCMPLAAAALAVVPVMALINRVYGPRLAERAAGVKSAEAALAAHVQDATDGSWTRRRPTAARQPAFPRSTRVTLAAWWRQARAQLAHQWLLGATQGLGAAVVFGYGGWLVHRKTAGLTVGDLTIFLSYVNLLWGPLGAVTGLSAGLAGGTSGARRVFEVLDAATIPTDGVVTLTALTLLPALRTVLPTPDPARRHAA